MDKIKKLIQYFFSKKHKKKLLNDESMEEKINVDEWYEPKENDGILQKIEKPKATTFKKKWIYTIVGLLSTIFLISLITGLFMGSSRKVKKTEEEPEQQQIVKGNHLQDIQNDSKILQKSVANEVKREPITPIPSSPPPNINRTYTPVPQPRYIPRTPEPPPMNSQMTAQEKALQEQLAAKQKANESPIKFNLNLEENNEKKL